MSLRISGYREEVVYHSLKFGYDALENETTSALYTCVRPLQRLVKLKILHLCTAPSKDKTQNVADRSRWNDKLKALNLGCTNMIELPSTMEGLSLMHLDLERTNLRMLPAEVGGMT